MFFICFICVFQLPSVHFRRIVSGVSMSIVRHDMPRVSFVHFAGYYPASYRPFEISSSRDVEVSVSFFLSAGSDPAFF